MGGLERGLAPAMAGRVKPFALGGARCQTRARTGRGQGCGSESCVRQGECGLVVAQRGPLRGPRKSGVLASLGSAGPWGSAPGAALHTPRNSRRRDGGRGRLSCRLRLACHGQAVLGINFTLQTQAPQHPLRPAFAHAVGVLEEARLPPAA